MVLKLIKIITVKKILNGPENFELSEESPQLFNNLDEDKETETQNFNSENEEDELEIPAFLRSGQKTNSLKINERHHHIGK